MNYTTEDAVALWREVQRDIEFRGHDEAFNRLHVGYDPELLALTLTLCVSASSPLSR